MFNTYNEKRFTAAIAGRSDVLGDCIEDTFSGIAPVVVDGLRTGGGENRDSAIVGLESTVNMHSIPRTCLLLFSDAAGIFPGVSECGAVEFAGQSAADIRANQSQRTTDGCVCTPP